MPHKDDQNWLFLEKALNLASKLTLDKDRLTAYKWIEKLKSSPNNRESRHCTELLIASLQQNKLVKPFKEEPDENVDLSSFLKYDMADISKFILEDETTTQPVHIATNGNMNEYVASQDIPKFGGQFYYACSPESIRRWNNLFELPLPRELHFQEAATAKKTVPSRSNTRQEAAREIENRENLENDNINRNQESQPCRIEDVEDADSNESIQNNSQIGRIENPELRKHLKTLLKKNKKRPKLQSTHSQRTENEENCQQNYVNAEPKTPGKYLLDPNICKAPEKERFQKYVDCYIVENEENDDNFLRDEELQTSDMIENGASADINKLRELPPLTDMDRADYFWNMYATGQHFIPNDNFQDIQGDLMQFDDSIRNEPLGMPTEMLDSETYPIDLDKSGYYEEAKLPPRMEQDLIQNIVRTESVTALESRLNLLKYFLSYEHPELHVPDIPMPKVPISDRDILNEPPPDEINTDYDTEINTDFNTGNDELQLPKEKPTVRRQPPSPNLMRRQSEQIENIMRKYKEYKEKPRNAHDISANLIDIEKALHLTPQNNFQEGCRNNSYLDENDIENDMFESENIAQPPPFKRMHKVRKIQQEELPLEELDATVSPPELLDIEILENIEPTPPPDIDLGFKQLYKDIRSARGLNELSERMRLLKEEMQIRPDDLEISNTQMRLSDENARWDDNIQEESAALAQCNNNQMINVPEIRVDLELPPKSPRVTARDIIKEKYNKIRSEQNANDWLSAELNRLKSQLEVPNTANVNFLNESNQSLRDFEIAEQIIANLGPDSPKVYDDECILTKFISPPKERTENNKRDAKTLWQKQLENLKARMFVDNSQGERAPILHAEKKSVNDHEQKNKREPQPSTSRPRVTFNDGLSKGLACQKAQKYQEMHKKEDKILMMHLKRKGVAQWDKTLRGTKLGQSDVATLGRQEPIKPVLCNANRTKRVLVPNVRPATAQEQYRSDRNQVCRGPRSISAGAPHILRQQSKTNPRSIPNVQNAIKRMEGGKTCNLPTAQYATSRMKSKIACPSTARNVGLNCPEKQATIQPNIPKLNTLKMKPQCSNFAEQERILKTPSMPKVNPRGTATFTVRKGVVPNPNNKLLNVRPILKEPSCAKSYAAEKKRNKIYQNLVENHMARTNKLIERLAAAGAKGPSNLKNTGAISRPSSCTGIPQTRQTHAPSIPKQLVKTKSQITQCQQKEGQQQRRTESKRSIGALPKACNPCSSRQTNELRDTRILKNKPMQAQEGGARVESGLRQCSQPQSRPVSSYRGNINQNVGTRLAYRGVRPPCQQKSSNTRS